MTTPTTLPGSSDFPEINLSLELLARAKGGDLGAMNDLFVRYQDRLQRIVRIRMGAQVRCWVESMDIVQGTYETAMKKLRDFEPRDTSSLLHWLSTIALNQIRAQARHGQAARRDRRLEVPLAPAGNSDSIGLGDPAISDDPAQTAWKEEIREILDDAVAALPDDQREVVLQHDYYGAGFEGVATSLDRSIEAVRQLHYRAWIRLRRIAGPKLESTRSSDGEVDRRRGG
jgi:RNA polymerase sigma-70 factor, ECF subfamily